MGILIVASYLLAGLSLVSLPSQLFLFKKVVPDTFFLSSKPSKLPSSSFEIFPPQLGEIIETQCHKVPSGAGIPGFQPGIGKGDVIRLLGAPTGSTQGYWPNTSAVFYELIPQKVSLGFLFDKKSERIRQTEASFIGEVDARLMVLTLNGMLGCKLNEQIQQGLQQVQQGETQQYSFTLNSLKGVIEKQKGDRLYIGIWESGLH